MILAGIPGSLGWMLILTFLGLLLMTVALLMSTKVWNESISTYLLLPLGLGALFGAGFVWIGISQLKERERLILDKTKRTGTYITTTPYLFTETTKEFSWDQIVEIEVGPSTLSQTSSPSGPFDTEKPATHQVALTLKDPPDQIILDIMEEGDGDKTNALTQAVSDFLGI